VPVVGSAILFASMAQAGWSLSMLLKSGVTALESLRITSGVIKNLAVSDCFENAANGLLTGRSLSKTFEQPHIPLMVRHMAALGESSGQLDSVMHDVGEYYQKELAAKVKLIAVMIEPMLILVVGGMVGFVYFSFFQAVMSVSKGGM
jgi:type IV pilus assembly protein PilC